MNIKKETYTGSSETTREILNIEGPSSVWFKDISCRTPLEPKSRKEGSKIPQPYPFDFKNYITFGIPEHKPAFTPTDAHFLEWLIGFFEADGCFLMWPTKNKQNRFGIEIVQKDGQLMYKLRTLLGFGRVCEYSKNEQTYWRYYVSDFKNLQRWILLVNGNLITEKKQYQFRDWLMEFNQTKNTTFDFLTRKPTVSLNTAWLSGFLEGDGGFWVNSNKIILTDRVTDEIITEQCKLLNVRLKLKFYVTQKDELILLKQIQTLFCISTKIYTITNGHTDFKYNRLETSNTNNITLIIDYLDKFPFLGKRHIIFLRWKRIFDYRLNCYPLTKKSIKKFNRLVSEVNKNDQNKKIQ